MARRRIPRHLRPERKFTPPEARVNYIYRLFDNQGRAVYIGRSCDPLARLKAHHASGAEWAQLVVGIEVWGPFNWADALRLERDAITAERPPGNKEFVINKRYRPASLLS